MRRLGLFFGLWLLTPPAAGQSATKTGPSPDLPAHGDETGTYSPYRPIRYLEEYAHLADGPRDDPWDPIKYVPLWRGGYLSFGGQHRLRYELVDPIDIGIGGDRATSSALLSRNLLHADLHLSRGIRIFAQLGGFYALGVPSSEARPPDADDLDVTQLFVESSAVLGGIRITGRVGRQEMALGSTRWVGTRDGTNVRQAFDLVRVTLAKQGGWSVETFVGAVPALRRGAFDDAPDWQDRFWGMYATLPVLPRKLLGLDVFYLGRRRPDAAYADVRGREVRHTFGMRIFGETDFGLEYVGHALVQRGAIEDDSVLAWGFAAALWQRLPGVLEPVRFGIRGDALSGDARLRDGRTTTFQPLFPNQSFFSALPAIYPTNLYDAHPLLRIEGAKVSFEAGCTLFFRQAIEDAVYAPPGTVLVSGEATRARYTAAQTSLSIGYKADRHLSFNAEYTHVFPGPAITDSGGTDVDFFGTWTTYTY
ncbi:alginate export family protein [Polyangium sp. 6x1]|uniref:alginate export family protein n=1 Tax=Polyangium sp. 6x1 TaxID=3042689 RepID=UPI002482CE2E|nr:alginate export family protein [Polyangium sp. 6x1]MDI1444326.1 alginate export family protein [Polyangium sp. 6x1]